jgi:hypothetical protein
MSEPVTAMFDRASSCSFVNAKLFVVSGAGIEKAKAIDFTTDLFNDPRPCLKLSFEILQIDNDSCAFCFPH